MELKSILCVCCIHEEVGSNCTFMELKYITEMEAPIPSTSSNCTFMELK